MFKEKCFKNLVSEIHKKYWFCPYTPPKTVDAFCLNFFLRFFSKSSFVDTWAICSQIWDYISLNMFFLFSTRDSKMSRNMSKLRHKVRKGHFYPMEVQISSISNLGFQIKFLLFSLGFQKHKASICL